MTDKIHVIDLATGKLITSHMPGYVSWDHIVDEIMDRFNCRRDDVRSIDDEDGIEFITVDGAPVARVDWVSDTKQRFAEMHDRTMAMLDAAE